MWLYGVYTILHYLKNSGLRFTIYLSLNSDQLDVDQLI